MDVVEEFRSNLLLLLHCRYPEGLGLPLQRLEGEYKMYYHDDVTPNRLGDGESWEEIFQQPEFREDFLMLNIGRTTFIKANRRRSPSEMSSIAKLAQHCHFDAAKKPEFQVIGCRSDFNNNKISSKNGTNDGAMLDPQLVTGIEQEHPEIDEIATELSSVRLGQGSEQQQPQGTSVGNESSQAVAVDNCQLDQADEPDPRQPDLSVIAEPTGQVNFVRDLSPPEAETATSAGSATVPQRQAQAVRDDSASAPDDRNVEESQVFKCSTTGCDQEFPGKQHLQDHERRCEKRKYPCTFPGCDRRFATNLQRRNHASSVHRSPGARLKCSVPGCSETFTRADRLKVHESRCRFKYDTLQQMAKEGANSNSSASLL